MELDDAFRHLGHFGRYQLLLFVLLNIILCWLPAFQLMGMVYISNTPKSYHCKPPLGFHANETVPMEEEDGDMVLESCRMYDVQDGVVTENVTGCQHGWEYETVHEKTSIITDVSMSILLVIYQCW